jgi:formylglycine-generating enzyme required for sulfatase activity
MTGFFNAEAQRRGETRRGKGGWRGRAVAGLGVVLAGMALAGCGGTGVGWVEVPEHRTRLGGLEWREAGGWEMARTEVTVGQWVAYLNGAKVEGWPESEQVERSRGGRWRARPGREREAVGWVSLGDAEGWCEWASKREGRRVRLPSGEEWEAAARGGIDGALWPLGWRAPRGEEAHWDASGPLKRAGTTVPNGWGVRDMAGNLHEWSAEGELRGGAWSDRVAESLQCAARRSQRAEVRSGDVGFRPLRERSAK